MKKGKNLTYDFSGYATKVDLKCSDGRVIKKNAFKDNDGVKVPLVWQHCHSDPTNVLGHAVLENRTDGVYAYCTFNETAKGIAARTLVEHGDVEALSIHATDLIQRGSDVIHGNIREVSLVLAGANPGAKIDNLQFQHGDIIEEDDEQAIIFSGIEPDQILHADNSDEKTIQEIFDSMTDEQKNVCYFMIAHALDSNEDGDDGDDQDNMNHSYKGGTKNMKKNVFEKTNEDDNKIVNTLTHAQFTAILEDAQKMGSFKNSILNHAAEYGIENIDVLFPDAKTLSKDPEWLKRETDWVAGVLAAINKNPFSRIKTILFDMDFDEARAKGYIKGNEKKEVYFKVAKRITQPTTVYVKQKLDRDDLIDVSDFDTIALIRYQMRILLDEELAMAALIGDGREANDPYKINEECVRPIWKDENLYAIKETLKKSDSYAQIIEDIAMTGERYKGSGSPVLYTTYKHHMKMLWVKDLNHRRIYENDAILCTALGVSKIIEVPAFENKYIYEDGVPVRELFGIKVNLRDYTFGADKGGQVATFDDFDIDFNQMKYLMETRCSGCLTKPKSAQIYEFDLTVEEEPVG